MHAFLVSGLNQELIQEKIEELAEKQKAKIIEFVLQKIEDARELAKFTRLSLKDKTAIVVKNIDNSSLETQNAFLKELEEPQPNLIYILTVQNSENVLPTILSRCEVIETGNSQFVVSNTDKKLVKEFILAPESTKLAIISKINKRDEAIEFMTNLIFVSHEMMVKDPSLVNLVDCATKTLSALKANGNVGLQLTNFVVNLRE